MMRRRPILALALGVVMAAPAAVVAQARGHASTRPATSGFMEATPEQIREAVEEARETAVKMPHGAREFETDHFRVFTDRPASDQSGIGASLEGSYAAVAKVFGIGGSEGVYVGKLPVYVFAERKDYRRFATKQDHLKQSSETAGYFAAESRYGFGHLVTFVPNGKDQKVVRETWSHVLTHEMTHSFVHRYRSNGAVPTWLNEGLAEFVAAEMYPHVYADNRAIAKDVAVRRRDMAKLFGGKATKRLSYEEYAASQTVVEMLFREDRTKFFGFLTAVKEGTKAEQALKDAFGCDYATLAATWRAWVMRH
jgi:hypothetical protein